MRSRAAISKCGRCTNRKRNCDCGELASGFGINAPRPRGNADDAETTARPDMTSRGQASILLRMRALHFSVALIVIGIGACRQQPIVTAPSPASTPTSHSLQMLLVVTDD